ncbi:hypothetical protein [uncultured Cardiobacterium sp.]|uniref:ATP-grasp domain-containing protein n=1 Tax=uncultured Cardiobacterium sp. TaxID=417619 RepID=UPI002623613B|nr:hypothetical protein [uncultured Cardiobacterium sp.]
MPLIIATCPAWPQGNADLRILAAALDAALIPWQDIAPAAATILPLAVWDYSDDPAAYRRWLAAQEQAGARLVNPPALQRWNLNKRYLCELAASGHPVTPGLDLYPGDDYDWARQIAATGWDNPVIKPLIGQSGRGVRRLNHDMPTLAAYPDGILVQPYIEAPGGEVCLIYFGGAYSHAAHRRPAAGEWRANSAYGVEILPVTPEPAWRSRAEAVLAALPSPPLYARVDGLITADGDYLINEIELIEPALYFGHHPAAVAAFCAALRVWQ